jgi:biopolymer transport protein ExbB
MIKVAILDDYQNVSQEFIDLKKLDSKYEIKIFSESFKNEEKAIENAGSLEMAFLEKNMGWLTAIVAIAPMMGFTGTVWGMIGAFEAIEAANDISPAVVAGGISQALLTTAFGLVVAMIIQICQNYFSSQIDGMVLDMEEKSIELTDLLRSAK